MTPPAPARTHIWDGTRTLPDWLTGHHWTAGQLVIHTPDGDTRPQPGWWLIGWTDGSVTAATPTVAARVYGPDGIAGRLAAAETEAARLRADIAACQAQQWPQRLAAAEKTLARVRALRNDWAATPRWVDHVPRRAAAMLTAALDGTPEPTMADLKAAEYEPAPGTAATQATEPPCDGCGHTEAEGCGCPPEPAGLRDLIAAALYERERPPNDPHWPDAYPMDREVFEPMADAVLAVILPATRITATLARMSDADVQRVISLYERWIAAGPPPLGTSINRWWDKRLAELHNAINPKEN